MSSEIKVVNCRKQELRKLGYNSLVEFLEADRNHMYVGRNMTIYVPGAVGSKWQNPFKVHKDNDANNAVKQFKEFVKSGPLYNDLYELEGKTLACWCYPAPCHATALKEMYEEKYGVKGQSGKIFDYGNDFPPLKKN